jgi:hypothetical protein
MILVECKADKVLVLSLGARAVEHGDNKAGICNRLQKMTHATAMVDEDPGATGAPSYLRRLQQIENYGDLGLKVLYDAERKNYVIVLRPRLEDWCLKAGRQAGVPLERYDLPADPDGLHRLINLHISKFQEWLNALKNADSPRARKLKSLIRRFNRVATKP